MIKYRRAIHFGLSVALFGFGIVCGIGGPTLIDITEWLGITDAEMGFARVAPAIAIIVSSLAAGHIFMLIRRDVAIVLTMILMSIVQIIIPFIRIVWIYILLTIGGAAAAMIFDIGANVWGLELFQDDNAVPLQVMHFCFSLGILVASLISPYFLVADTITDPLTGEARSLTPDEKDYTPLRQLFALPAVFLIANALYLAVVIVIIQSKKTKNNTISDQKPANPEMAMSQVKSENGTQPVEPASTPSQSLKFMYKAWAVAWAMGILGLQVGVESTTNSYLTTFLYKEGFEKTRAVMINSYGLFAFNIGRLVGIFCATRFSSRSIFMWLTALYMISSSGLYLMPIDPGHDVLIAVLVAAMNVGYSANYPAMVSYINTKIPITNKVAGFLFGVIGVVLAIDPLIVGPLIDQFPKILPAVLVIHGALVFLSVAVLEMSFMRFRSDTDRYFKPITIKAS